MHQVKKGWTFLCREVSWKSWEDCHRETVGWKVVSKKAQHVFGKGCSNCVT